MYNRPSMASNNREINSVTDRKKVLREQMLAARLRFPPNLKHEAETRVCEQLNRLIDEHRVRVLHTFLPMGREMDHTPVIWQCLKNGITVVTTKTLPKRQLQHLVLKDMDNLADGVFGTKYPRDAREWTGSYDMIIVPGLAFDKQGRRLGYGGGYYDTFLAKHPGVLKVAIAFPFQVVAEVPADVHDERVDLVIT